MTNEATDNEYERRVLTTPGVAEGFDEACREIETWKRGLGEGAGGASASPARHAPRPPG
jgi:hypothetical protein